jgi:hypothetical protein
MGIVALIVLVLSVLTARTAPVLGCSVGHGAVTDCGRAVTHCGDAGAKHRTASDAGDPDAVGAARRDSPQ